LMMAATTIDNLTFNDDARDEVGRAHFWIDKSFSYFPTARAATARGERGI
jgi:hypothetical protein